MPRPWSEASRRGSGIGPPGKEGESESEVRICELSCWLVLAPDRGRDAEPALAVFAGEANQQRFTILEAAS